MSIVAMNWALRQRLASPLQQILLYVIADSADPEGVTRYCDPAYMEQHARLTRSTMFRMLGDLQGQGLLERRKFYTERGDVRYEIVLNLEALVDTPIRRRKRPDDTGNSGEDEDGTQGEEMNEIPESHPETMVSADQSPTGAQAKSQSCDYHIDDPSLPKKESPPYPPPGGALSKMELEAKEKRDALWERFKAGYPSIARMDQRLAREALDELSLDDAEWAVSVVPALAEQLRKDDCPPKNAHLWLRKEMFRNFTRALLRPAAADNVLRRYPVGSREGRAVIALCAVARKGLLELGGMVSFVGDLTLAILAFADADPKAIWIENEAQIAAWRRFAARHVRGERAEMLTDRGIGESIRFGIWAPWAWPPAKNGKVYDEQQPNDDEPGDRPPG